MSQHVPASLEPAGKPQPLLPVPWWGTSQPSPLVVGWQSRSWGLPALPSPPRVGLGVNSSPGCWIFPVQQPGSRLSHSTAFLGADTPEPAGDDDLLWGVMESRGGYRRHKHTFPK